MSHSGNHARLRPVPPTPPNSSGLAKPNRIATEQLYNPSVFRYKCIGALHLNSDQKGSPGVCRGLQSRMEKVANMVPDTREAAIKKFLDAASDLGTYVDADAAEGAADQKVKEIYTSRTMIYKDDGTLNAADDDDANKKKKDPSDSTPRVAKIQRAHKSTAIPEEDLIDKTEWSCYGSTQVHYLVLDPIVQNVKVEKRTNRRGRHGTTTSSSRSDLPPELEEMEKRAEQMFDEMVKRFGGHLERPGRSIGRSRSRRGEETTSETSTTESRSSGGDSQSDDEDPSFSTTTVVTRVITSSSSSDGGKITAITPENIGLSVRKIDSEVGHFTVADIGSIRICMETSNSLIGDGDKATGKNSGAVKENRQMKENISNAESSSMRPKVKDGSSEDGTGKTGSQAEDRTRTVDLKKFYNFTWKVAEKMNENVHLCKDAVSEDFPARTYNFGTKVVGRMQKTTEQTFTYMGKLLDGFWKST